MAGLNSGAFLGPVAFQDPLTAMAARRSRIGCYFRRVLGLSATVQVAAVVWTGGGYQAHAQVIDEYLNAGIPGFDTAAGVTVATRQHPEYDALGIRLGDFIITPVLQESGGYDTNVTGTQNGKGSALIETNASVNAAGGWSDTRFAAGLTVDDVEYPDQSNQGFTNWTTALGGSHDFGRDTLNIGYTHLNLNQTPRDLDVPGLNQTIAYRVDDLRANYHIDLGRFFLQPGIRVSYYSFDNGTVGEQPYLQTYRDRLVFSPELIGSYEFATRRRVVVILRNTQSDFDRSPPGQPRQNFNDTSVLGGVAYDVDGVIGFRLLGGYEERSFAASNAYHIIQAPILEGSATWTPTGLTTVTGSAARYIEDSAAEATVGYTETALKLQIDHEYLRNVILSLHGAVYLDDYQQSANDNGGGNQSSITVGGGASWLLNRNMRVAADYTYSTRNSSGGNGSNPSQDLLQNGEVFGSNYSESTFRVTLRFAL